MLTNMIITACQVAQTGRNKILWSRDPNREQNPQLVLFASWCEEIK